MATVKLEKINKKYGDACVVVDLDLVVNHGEFVTLVGPSGCGKTTTLRMIAGLEKITSGELYIGHTLANDLEPKDRHISMVFQSYALFPHMTVVENIAFGLKVRKHSRGETMKKTHWAVGLLNLDGLETRLPKDLSGGQRQRVALARALVVNPDVLLLDEPLSNLDATLRVKMRAELKRIHKQLETTIVYVTHDQVEAMSLSERIAVMREGRLIQIGAPLEVYNAPENIFVAGFIGSPSMNFFNGTIMEENGKGFVKLEALSLSLPERLWARCRGLVNKDIVFGIRPEHIHDKKSAKTKDLCEKPVDVVVDVVEPLGDRDVVEVKKNDMGFTVLLDPEAKTAPDKTVAVVFDMEKTHIFDKRSGKNVTSGNFVGF